NEMKLPGRILTDSRNYAHAVLEKKLKGHRETALAKALLTGDRNALDDNLVHAYANAGVIHIMAISGLHIGLIYLFLINILNTIPVIKKNEKVKLVFVLAGIWFFALMTGGSPSVMRAS